MIIKGEIRVYFPRHAHNIWNSTFLQNYVKRVLHGGERGGALV
jgi:hypothetical protein